MYSPTWAYQVDGVVYMTTPRDESRLACLRLPKTDACLADEAGAGQVSHPPIPQGQ